MNAPEASTSDADQHKNERVNNNTLNTLYPAQHEAMNTATTPAQPGTPVIEPLEMRDIVLWQYEEAQQLGEVGLTTNFPEPSDIFTPFTIDPSSEVEPPAEDRAALEATMQETHKAIMLVQQRKILMEKAGPLLERTETDVNQKLLAEGINEQELQDKSLRQKIVQLVELKEPPPKANFVAVLVAVASETEGGSIMLDLNLPLKADVAEVHALLDEVVKAMLFQKGFSYEQGGNWKYQLIDQSRSQVLMNRSLPLETDLDYTTMLQQVSEVDGGKAPMPVLTQVCHCHSLRIVNYLVQVHAHCYGNRMVSQSL